MSEHFDCVILNHFDGCQTPHLSAPCNCADAPRKWICKTCKYEFSQIAEPTLCHVCPYLMRKIFNYDHNAVKVVFKRVFEEHDGYCSDAENMGEVEEELQANLPADVDTKQLTSLRWAVKAGGHCCCCGASESWRDIRVLS